MNHTRKKLLSRTERKVYDERKQDDWNVCCHCCHVGWLEGLIFFDNFYEISSRHADAIFIQAAIADDLHIMRFMREHDANDYWNAMRCAVQHGHIRAMVWIAKMWPTKMGRHIRMPNYGRESLLGDAIEFDQPRSMRLLIQWGAMISHNHLSDAIDCRSHKVRKIMIRKGIHKSDA